jgi:hypothetical protein
MEAGRRPRLMMRIYDNLSAVCAGSLLEACRN